MTWATALSGANMFILAGGAGFGKSTIARTVAERLKEQGYLGASFFFVRGIDRLSTTRLLFRTIAHQLAFSFPTTLRPLIIQAIKNRTTGKILQLQEEIDDFIRSPLSKVSSGHNPVIIVIDALDECADHSSVKLLLGILGRAIPTFPFPFKVFLTGRPELHIQNAIYPYTSSGISKLFVLHNTESSIVDSDIKIFIRYRLDEMDCSYTWREEDDIITILARLSGGLFIYVATALQFIEEEVDALSRRERLDFLLEKPIGSSTASSRFQALDDLYIEVLQASLKKPLRGYPDKSQELRTVLGSVVLLNDRLSPKALGSLLQLSPEAIRSSLSKLNSILFLPSNDQDDEAIRIHHASFPDFLTDRTRCEDERFFIDSKTHHNALTIYCLEMMLRYLQPNICKLPNTSAFNSKTDDLAERTEQHTPPHPSMPVSIGHHIFRGQLNPKSFSISP